MVNWHESSPVCGARQLCAWLLLSALTNCAACDVHAMYAFYYYFYSGVKGRTGPEKMMKNCASHAHNLVPASESTGAAQF
jgi:hypothetical protein